jgi:hypothetical protein
VRTPTPRPSPTLRAVLLSGVALGTGCLAHLSAGGLMPGPLPLLALLVLGAVLARPLLHRQASTPRLVAMLVGGQAAVHLALTALAGHHDEEPVPPGATAAVHHLVADLTGRDALMALAHAVAAALVGLWLAAGERALFTVVHLLRSRLAPPPAVRLPTTSVAPSPWSRRAPRPRQVALPSAPVRGPPYAVR